MKVILLEDVKNVGYAGSIKNVKDGFARNFLIPNKKAMLATNNNIKLIQSRQNNIQQKVEKITTKSEALKQRLDGISIEINAKAGNNGKLFGSVTANDIAVKLKENNIDVDRKNIKIPDSGIKAVGEYDVVIFIFRDIKATVKVKVNPIDG